MSGKSARRFVSNTFGLILGLWLAGQTGKVEAAGFGHPLPLDRTVAFELFRIEAEARALQPADEYEARLRSTLVAMYASLGRNPRPPANPDEFLSFAENASIALAAMNYIQPQQREDWIDSLGQALQPVPESHPRLQRYVDQPDRGNIERLRYAARGRPFYFLDCDTAALLLISVAQMVGFEIALVHAPDHEFVRWEDGRGNYRNWDWTNWASFSDAKYRWNYDISHAQVARGVHLSSSTLRETMGYFIAGVSRLVQDEERKLELRRRAAELSPNNPVAASNIAWSFATNYEGVTPEERREALIYSLSAWAGFPDSPVSMNNLACALAERGEWSVAVALQQRSLELQRDTHRSDLLRIQRLESDLDRLRNHTSCRLPRPESEDD